MRGRKPLSAEHTRVVNHLRGGGALWAPFDAVDAHASTDFVRRFVTVVFSVPVAILFAMELMGILNGWSGGDAGGGRRWELTEGFAERLRRE